MSIPSTTSRSSPGAHEPDTFRCHGVHVRDERSRVSTAERFHRLCVLVVHALPAPLNSLVAPTFLGFAVINTFTFGVDLAILTLLHGVFRYRYRSR